MSRLELIKLRENADMLFDLRIVRFECRTFSRESPTIAICLASLRGENLSGFVLFTP